MRCGWTLLAALGPALALGSGLGAAGCGGGDDDAPAPDAAALDAALADAALPDAAPPDARLADAGPRGALGVAYSPRGAAPGATEITAFYDQHAAYGALIAYHMNWRDPGMPGGTAPGTAAMLPGLASAFGFTPVIGFGWDVGGVPDLTSASEPGNNTWSNAETRMRYRTMVTDYAAAVRPRYLFLGNEINTYALAHTPAEWASWVSEYRACYDAIKAASPGTIVFTTFQLEHLAGLGRKNGWTQPAQWQLIDDFAGKLDAAGFTTYPYFEYETPADVPADYYTRLRARFAGPLIFSETAWVADPAAPYTGSEAEQRDWVTTFFARTAGLPVEYTVWLFRHDPPGLPAAFSRSGLSANDGTARLADAAWRARVAAGP